MKDIVRNEGINSLYSGLKPTLIRTIPATATLFVTYEYTKRFMLNFFENNWWIKMILFCLKTNKNYKKKNKNKLIWIYLT